MNTTIHQMIDTNRTRSDFSEEIQEFSKQQRDCLSRILNVMALGAVGIAATIGCSESIEQAAMPLLSWYASTVSGMWYIETKWKLPIQKARKNIQDFLKDNPSLERRFEASEKGVRWEDVL